MIENHIEVEIGLFQDHLFRLDLGQIEDVIYDRQQMLARRCDLGQLLGLFRLRMPALHQMG